MKKNWLALLTVLALLLTATVGFASEVENTDAIKVLTVDAAVETETVGSIYNTIQAAIDFVAAQDDSTGWTINVKNGTYERFTVPHWNKSGIVDLSIIGESEEDVIVNVLNAAYTESALVDNGGINIFGTNVLLQNMTITAGTNKQAWDDAAISTNHGMSGGANVTLTVDNCTLVGPGIGNGATYGIFWACSGMSVTNCNISGFANAIEFMNDGFNVPAGQTYAFTGNTITGASFAFHGYMGGGNGGGTLLFENNIVTGTTDLRSKVICQDNTTNSFIVDIKNNKMQHAIVGLVNLKDEGDVVSVVLNSNTFGDNCCYVEAIEPGTIELWSTFHAPVNDYGMWVRPGITFEDYSVWYKAYLKGSHSTVHRSEYATQAEYNDAFDEFFATPLVQNALLTSYNNLSKYIDDAIAASNKAVDGKLSITGLENHHVTSEALKETEPEVAELCKDWEVLIPTFTWFKDGIYWKSMERPTPVPTRVPTPRPTAVPTATPSPTPDMSDLPETGDNSNFEVFAALLFVSAAGMLLLLKNRSA